MTLDHAAIAQRMRGLIAIDAEITARKLARRIGHSVGTIIAIAERFDIALPDHREAMRRSYRDPQHQATRRAARNAMQRRQAAQKAAATRERLRKARLLPERFKHV